jgi:hypothetical protein
MKLRLIFTIIVYIVITGSVSSQIQNNENFYSVCTVLNDGYDLLKKPGSWDYKDIITFAAVSGITITANQFDNQIRKDAIKDLTVYKKPIFKAAKFYGEPWPGAAIAVGLFTYGTYYKNEEFKRTGFEIFESFLYSGVVTSVLKSVIGRSRPFTNNGSHSFSPFSFNNESTSFPSGHTTLAMSLSTVLASHVDNIYIKGLIFIPPFLTATERVLQDAHWTSDVFMGAAIGYFVSSYIVNKHNEPSENDQSIMLIPGIDLNGRFNLTIIF